MSLKLKSPKSGESSKLTANSLCTMRHRLEFFIMGLYSSRDSSMNQIPIRLITLLRSKFVYFLVRISLTCWLVDQDEVSSNLERKNIKIDPQSSDISFKIQGQHFSAHKNALAAKSQFFKNMFESTTKFKSSEISLEDVEPSLFKGIRFRILTEYIYY